MGNRLGIGFTGIANIVLVNPHLVDFILGFSTSKCASASPFMLARLVPRWAMPAGNFIALSMASSLMVKCHQTKRLEVETIPLTHSSARLVQESMSPEQYL